jgi:hypothetical protein
MKDSTKARILAAGLGVAAMLTPAACDNGTGTDWVIYSFTANSSYTVTIEDQTGSGARINEIKELVITLEGFVAKDLKIILKPGSASDIEVAGHTFIVYNDWDAPTLGIKLQTAITSHDWAAKANTFNPAVRLAQSGRIINRFSLRQRGDARLRHESA